MAFREFGKNTRETVRVTPNKYEGHDLIDIRVYARNPATGEVGPTKKGISLNVDTVPELIDALTWALGQPCEPDGAAVEHVVDARAVSDLADEAWKILVQHGSAVHWDSAERMVLGERSKLSKWDLHSVLASRRDLFERVDRGTFRARRDRGGKP